jgi:prepilin-type N-terminal cleavage/methylation domain-containing protein
MRSNARSRGFSLLELMAVMAILSVLSMVAIFSYKVYIRKARNGEAVAFLMDIKMKQETYFMAYSRYVSTTATGPDGWFPSTANFTYTPSPWVAGSTLSCDPTPTDAAIIGFCALGLAPTSPETFFQYVTMGWSPGVDASTITPTFIRDTARRWWFARSRGYAGTGSTMPFEFRISSELNEIIEIPPTTP